MSCINSSRCFVAAVMLLVTGCGEPDRAERLLAETYPLDLRDPARVTEAARYSDPVVMMMAGVIDLSLMFQAFAYDRQIGCFRLIDHSDRAAGIADWRIEGSCEWSDEDETRESAGSIVGRGDTSGTRIEYRGFRSFVSRPGDCGGAKLGSALDGVVEVPYLFAPQRPGPGSEPPDEAASTGEGHYALHLYHERWGAEDRCVNTRMQLAYDVTIDHRIDPMQGARPDGDPGAVRPTEYQRKLYDVEGRVAVHQETRAAVELPWEQDARSPGAWRLAASDYGLARDDGACGDFVTGTLRLESGADVAVLSPDASTSCFNGAEAGAAEYACTRWSLNGAEQPEELCGFVWLMDGIGCSAGPDARPPWVAMAIFLTGLLWQRFRRRRAA